MVEDEYCRVNAAKKTYHTDPACFDRVDVLCFNDFLNNCRHYK